MIKLAEDKVSSTLGFFIGSEHRGEGAYKEKEGTWVRYSLKFKPSKESDKTFSMTVFNSLPFKDSIKMGALVMGTQYLIKYNEESYTNKEGKSAKSKTAVGIYIPTAKECLVAQQTQNTQQPHMPTGLDLSSFESFKPTYLSKCKEIGRTPDITHMVGSFVSSKDRDRFAALIEKCKEALK